MKRETDEDHVETKEWIDAINSVMESEGVERAQYILQRIWRLHLLECSL